MSVEYRAKYKQHSLAYWKYEARRGAAILVQTTNIDRREWTICAKKSVERFQLTTNYDHTNAELAVTGFFDSMANNIKNETN